MQLVDAERAAEVLQDFVTVRGHVEGRGMVVEHVVDEPRGEVEEELAADRPQDAFDVHAAFENRREHQVTDLVVVLGLGEHALGRVAEGGATVAGGLILAVGNLQVSDRLVGDGAHAVGQSSLATTVFAAFRAGCFPGRAVYGYNDRCVHPSPCLRHLVKVACQ